jgi:protein O-mannosyl-transferase
MDGKKQKKGTPSLQKIKPADKAKPGKGVVAGTLTAILLLTYIIYSNSINNGFIANWDDDAYIENNIGIRDLTFDKALGFFRLDSVYSNNYHPLTILSYAIEAKIFGTASARPFHSTNLILHLMNVCLVFYLIYLITAKWNISAIVAVLFAVHPMHVESVSWISERKDVLYALFYLGSAIFYSKFIQSQSRYRYLTISFVLFLLSCLSKSMAVSLPAILLLIDYLHSRKITKTVIAEKIPYFLIALLFASFAIRSQDSAIAANIALQINYLDRIFIVLYGFIYYPLMLVFPLSLSAIHYYPEKAGRSLPILFYLAPVAIAFILASVNKAKTFKREFLFGLLFYVMAILPVIQIIPIGLSMVSERYSYIPFIGLFFIIGVVFNGLAENKFGMDTRRLYFVSKIILIISIGLFAAMSFGQNGRWKDGMTLFTQVIERYPAQSHAYVSRGAAKMKANDWNGAFEDFSHAIQYNPKSAEAYNNRSAVENSLQRYDQSLRDCREAIRIKPGLADAYSNCGVALSDQGKYQDSLNYFQTAIEKNSKHFIALNNIARAKCMLGNYEEALRYSNRSIELNPYYPDAYLSRGNIRRALNNIAGAIEDYSKSIDLDSTLPQTYRNRGLCYLESNNYMKAVADLGKATSMDPGDPSDFFDLGVAYYHLSQIEAACEAWNVAAGKGHAEAEEAIKQYCR